MRKYFFIDKMAIVMQRQNQMLQSKAAEFLQEEIRIRAGIEVPVLEYFDRDRFCIVLEYEEDRGKEEFALVRNDNNIVLTASDQRGFLYGVSYLLRKMYLKSGKIGVWEGVSSCRVKPSYALRGHQLGYRDLQNTCPSWTEKEFERYIRDLLIFGTNSIEIFPPRTDDLLFSGHFQKDPFEMMLSLSELIHSYGLEVYMWYPYLSADIKQETMQQEMAEREKIFSNIPYLDGILIPAGDPGDLTIEELMQTAAVTAEVLHKYHPKARIWVSPQVVSPEEDWYDRFYEELRKEPDWLYGICFAPWEKDSIWEMHERIPKVYRDRIRNYPDITHNMGCQFPVPDWDPAFSYTFGREGCNARPYEMEKIHKHHRKYVMGSITYSEGVHDDLNKIVWGSLDYQSEETVEEIVRDYVCLLIDPDLEDALTEVILQLEKNWSGEILENTGIDSLYEKIEKIDHIVDKKVQENFRYQMLLLRVVGDYQTKIRYAHDQKLEQEAWCFLEDGIKAGCADSDDLIRGARSILMKTWTEPVGVKERFWLQKLADMLYKSCKIRLTTSHHGGRNYARGAWLDTLNLALNDFQRMNLMFCRISKMEEETQKIQALKQMVNRLDPGEGGLYIHLGSLEGFRFVENKLPFEEDPGFLKGPFIAHAPGGLYMDIGWYDAVPIAEKWLHCAATLYGNPLTVKIEGLDPQTEYELMVTYPDILANRTLELSLYAGDMLIHSLVERMYKNGEDPDVMYRYSIPKDAYQNGCLTLQWKTYHVLRACNVCELWIKRKEGK